MPTRWLLAHEGYTVTCANFIPAGFRSTTLEPSCPVCECLRGLTIPPMLLTFGESEQERLFLWVKVRGALRVYLLSDVSRPLLTLSRPSLPSKTSSKDPGLARGPLPHLFPFLKYLFFFFLDQDQCVSGEGRGWYCIECS